MPDRAALQVLADRSLFQSIKSFAPGIQFFVLRAKRQLKCLQPPPAGSKKSSTLNGPPHEDVELWQNAVSTGDMYTLEALHALAALRSGAGRQVRGVLRGVFSYALTLAMDTRNMSLLDWIHANKMFRFDRPDSDVLFKLGEQGDLQMLRLVHEHGFYINRVMANGAAARGHLDMLQYIQSLGRNNARIDSGAIPFAAANGHLHVLEFLILQTEGDLRADVMQGYSKAIESGHLHVVQYLHENGFECQDYAMIGAGANGHLDVVKYLQMNQIGNKGGDSALTSALTNGHIEVAKFLVATGRTCSIGYAKDLVKNNELEIPQILCERGSDYNIEDALFAALQYKNLTFVKFLYALNPAACARQGNCWVLHAAKNGFLEFIEFFHECGDPEFFDYSAMHFAAANGHLDIVKFLHENRDEPFYISALREAFKRGHHHIVDYLCENRPVENAEHWADYERHDGHQELAEKIEHGAAAALAAGRKLYRY